MTLALYRKYRSRNLDELVGQDHIVTVLKNAIASDRVAHAYLLTGPRGVGKTSVARILAYAINGVEYDDNSGNVDIIEIDAASNNGVDDVRDLRDKAALAPMNLRKKVYIIDEVHMLSKPAFNALLKILEEPPAHIVFILATTDVDKLPATVISRTQRFNFRAITPEAAVGQLSKIAKAEKIKIEDGALELIARRGGGSFRDSISLLDQLSSLTSGTITASLIESSLGLASSELIDKLLKATEKGEIDEIIKLLDEAHTNGISSGILVDQLVEKIRQSAAAKPELLRLLDSLLDVPKNVQPDFKLLSVLGTFAKKPVSREMPLLVTPHVIEKDVAELIETPEIAEPAKSVKIDDFSWDKLIELVRAEEASLYAILAKADAELDNQTLIINTHNSFHKKKLDDAKYMGMLYKSLEKLGITGLNVHTISTPRTPKDSQAAKIVAMMGGEEVKLEE